jgi:MFS transporter, DHA1 family, multidrug resistance protein
MTVMDKKQQNIVLLVLGAIAGLGPFAVDMYIPGFSVIARDLKTSAGLVALTLTSFAFGTAVGQLLAGPVLDRFGRKKPIFLGLLLFIMAAALSIFTPSIYILIVLRFFLAIGCCVGMVGSNTIVRDLFSGVDMARALSVMAMVFGVAPVIAPTLGGFIVGAAGWRVVFVVLTGIGIFVTFSVKKVLPETKDPDPTVSLYPVKVLRGYWEVIRVRQFLLFAMIGGCASAGLFSFITGSPTVLMEVYHFSPTAYGPIFGTFALITIGANQINRFLLRRMTPLKILRVFLPIQSVIALLLLVGTYFGLLAMLPTLILVGCYLFCFGCIPPNATAILLQPFSKNIGSASALAGSIAMLICTFASAAIGHLHNGTAIPMVFMFAVFTLIAVFLIMIEGKRL